MKTVDMILKINKDTGLWVVNLEPLSYSEEVKRQSLYIGAYIWNLEEMLTESYLQGLTSEGMRKNRLRTWQGKERGGMQLERVTLRNTILPCVNDIPVTII